MNAVPRPRRPSRRLLLAMLALNVACLAGVALQAHDAQGVALGVVPLAVLLVALA